MEVLQGGGRGRERHLRGGRTTVAPDEEPHGRAPEQEGQQGSPGGPANPTSGEAHRHGRRSHRRAQEEIGPPAEPGDRPQRHQGPGPTGGCGIRIGRAQREEKEERREDEHQVVVETGVVRPLEEKRGRQKHEERGPGPRAEHPPGQQAGERGVGQGQRGGPHADGVGGRTEDGETRRVQIGLSRAHVALAVKEEGKPTPKDVEAHQAGRRLVEPEAGRGGDADSDQKADQQRERAQADADPTKAPGRERAGVSVTRRARDQHRAGSRVAGRGRPPISSRPPRTPSARGAGRGLAGRYGRPSRAAMRG